MSIKITEFGKRHFDKTFGGTKVLDITPEDFEKEINSIKYNLYGYLDGYDTFCKLLPIENFTDARVGSLPLTNENYIWLKSGYSARRDSELPVFSRWLELPMDKPKAEWLMLVLYSKEQIDKEAMVEYEKDYMKYVQLTSKMTGPELIDCDLIMPNKPTSFDADWGIVAILGQSHPNEEPMKPETMIRNALGISEGGSGTPLNREQYMRSVNFWDKNATVK